MRPAVPAHDRQTAAHDPDPFSSPAPILSVFGFLAYTLLCLLGAAFGCLDRSALAQTLKPGTARHPTVFATVATRPITIDGKLDEPDWATANVIRLTQQSPYPGKETPYITEVRILIDHDALIFGFLCIDPHPAKIVTHTLARDGDLANDDSISVVLDSFDDHRTGYFFQINPEAARVDGLIAGKGNLQPEWDGIWTAKTARVPNGWSAEMKIPAQTLTFTSGNPHWGIEFDRFIPRDQTELRWASPSLDADLFDMSRDGTLVLPVALKQGLGLEWVPYARGERYRDFSLPDPNWLGAAGGEFTWRLSPQLAGVLTINTDFAETEVDSRQLDVTPFPLYFPEKRAFFLEGANQYVFGLGLNSIFLPFFSRNVGLLDGYNIPMEAGAKLNGHVGPWSLAFLDVETRKATVPPNVVSDLALPSPTVDGTNLLASRVTYDVDEQLRLGAMVTHGDPEALLSNTFAGADAYWHTSKFLKTRTLQFAGWGATTQGEVPSGEREAWGIRFEYPNDLLNCAADTNHFGDGFDPLLGFLPRPATHQTTASCSYRPRPDQNGPFRAIRQASYDLNFFRITDTSGNLQSQQFLINPVNFTSATGASVMLTAYVRHETLTTPFAIVPSVTYPVGSYDFQRYGLAFNTSTRSSLQFFNDSTVGGYYNGHLYHQKNRVLWAPFHGRTEFEVDTDNFFAHTPQGKFTEKLWQFKGAVSLNPDFTVSTFVQYDNVSFALSSNTRLQWTLRPGDDFFLIWDRSWQRNLSQPATSFDPEAESVTAKIRWTFRM
jgi:hypothetical protein